MSVWKNGMLSTPPMNWTMATEAATSTRPIKPFEILLCAFSILLLSPPAVIQLMAPQPK